MSTFSTDAERDQWAMERLTNMLDSGIKSATEADQSHQGTGNKNAARAWRNLSIRLELLADLVASGLFDRIKAGGPEWDAIKAYREARDEREFEKHEANEAWLDAHPDEFVNDEDGFEPVVQQGSIWADPAVRRAVHETIAESGAE